MVIFIANVVGLVGFCKCWFNVLFGMDYKLRLIPVYDLTIRELLTIISVLLFLFISTLTENYYII
jgi:hypothetical protein